MNEPSVAKMMTIWFLSSLSGMARTWVMFINCVNLWGKLKERDEKNATSFWNLRICDGYINQDDKLNR